MSFSWEPPTVGILSVSVNVSIQDVCETLYDDNEQYQTVVVGIINTDTGELFETIQQALDDVDTDDGDTIFVPHGIYTESVIIHKNITLRGENKQTTIIQSNNGNYTVLQIEKTNGVIVEGFTIENGTVGIFISNSSSVIKSPSST